MPVRVRPSAPVDPPLLNKISLQFIVEIKAVITAKMIKIKIPEKILRIYF